MAVERSLVIIKPDAVRRGLVGQLLARYEQRGLRIVAMDLRMIGVELADRHYAEHLDKDWYPTLREFITSGPSVAMIVEGEQCVAAVRAMNGATDARAAAAGTIRGDYGLSNRENLVHASDSPQSAEREMALFFPELAA